MSTGEHCERTSQFTGSQNMNTDTTRESAAADAENMDIAYDKLTFASLDNTSDTPTVANVDNTSDTQTLASDDNTSDTLSLARIDRENQGPWEVEYSYGGEADLHGQYVNCDKNPGHKNFIPVDKFSINDLPEDYRHNDVFDYIRALSELTVRVTVKNVSDRRPDTIPKSCKPDAGYSVRARRRMMIGTGCVSSVVMSNNSEDGPCKCKECRNSSTQVMGYATISIKTASHVAFEDHDGQHTTCHLFFDRGNTPDTCSGVVTFTDTFMLTRDNINDVCHIQYISHDLDLARRLQQTLIRMFKLQSNFYNVPPISKYKLGRDDLDRQPLLFIVSHPHGCSKQVSVGRWINADILSSVIVSFLYNTATCPGTSGASVCALPAFADPQMDGRSSGATSLLDGVHCGSSALQLGLNFCRSNIGFTTPTLVSLEILPLDKGPLEDFFCLMEDDDTNKHYTACKRNPGHRNFFPLDKFNTDDLSPFYGRDDMVKCIKLVADLTVRVTVNYVSEKRPETVPGTDIPYPWISNRGSNLMRVGSGWVYYIATSNSEDCPCKECKISPRPQRQFAYIMITTSTHLVYDKLEADRTTCDLFFDSGETPDVCKDVVTLKDTCRFNKSSDTCRIWYCTHNMDLVCRLDNTLDGYRDNFRSLIWYDNVKSTVYAKQNSGENTKLATPLNIVVSHPHGCAKQISIGHRDIRGSNGTGGGQCSIEDIVCPGSSGAPVFLLSRQLFYPCV